MIKGVLSEILIFASPKNAILEQSEETRLCNKRNFAMLGMTSLLFHRLLIITRRRVMGVQALALMLAASLRHRIVPGSMKDEAVATGAADSVVGVSLLLPLTPMIILSVGIASGLLPLTVLPIRAEWNSHRSIYFWLRIASCSNV